MPRNTPEQENEPITEFTPLTIIEQKFIKNYIECGAPALALKNTGLKLDNDNAYTVTAMNMLKQDNVKAEINSIMMELKKDTVATAEEVMGYFTKVMRGEEKDQFGLDAPLAERTKAAQELAKRTIDIENRKAGNADKAVAIQLDWTRD